MKKQNQSPEKNLKSKMGRPTKYSKELADKICKAVSSTEMGLIKLCASREDFPHPDTIYEWRFEHKYFSDLYAQAKLKQADILAESCIDISDDCKHDIKVNEDGSESFNGEFVARSRLRVDTRKWLASKLLPKQYGDRHEMEKKEEENEKLREEIRLLREKLDSKNKRDY